MFTLTSSPAQGRMDRLAPLAAAALVVAAFLLALAVVIAAVNTSRALNGRAAWTEKQRAKCLVADAVIVPPCAFTTPRAG